MQRRRVWHILKKKRMAVPRLLVYLPLFYVKGLETARKLMGFITYQDIDLTLSQHVTLVRNCG
jgi:hypothetical protein